MISRMSSGIGSAGRARTPHTYDRTPGCTVDDGVKDTGGGTERGGAGVDVTAVADSALGGAATTVEGVGIAAEEPDTAIKDITQSIAS